MRAARRGLAIIVAIVVIVVGASVLWWAVSGTKMTWESAEMVGEDELVITYTGSSCEDQNSINVVESATSVTITITARTYRLTCKDVAEDKVVTVRLTGPLRDRQLLDGSCHSSDPCVRSAR